MFKYQAEKKLKVQLASVEQQRSKTQETVKLKETELEKMRAELKTIQGSLEEEVKKLKGQVTELQDVCVKKVRSFYKLQITTYYSENLLICIFRQKKKVN